jgi:glycerol-3-phosphate O-acyltransferase
VKTAARPLATSSGFTAGAELLAAELDRDPAAVLADVRACLEEMETAQRPWAVRLWALWARFLYSRAYELHTDPRELARLRELGARHPLVFLPSHRSNLDGYVMASLLHEHGFPQNHTLGGINMAFWPLGAIGRRVGVIWIRRSFRDDEIYKFTLRRYLGQLVGSRCNLEWYIEGSRSRTGKLLPPRLGLFNYLADAVEELDVDDVHLVPVSIVYDELEEALEMTTESHGAVKRPEGLSWLLRFARAQRGSFGAVRVNLGEPIALTDALRAYGSPPGDADPARRRLARSKVAFEVCVRINQATPATTTSLVTLALLGVDGRALTLDEVRGVLGPLLAYVGARGIPGHRAAEELATAHGVERALQTLTGHGVVERFDDGPRAVYRIGPDRELVAAFYRNAAIHWFVARAIVELALLRAAEAGGGDLAQIAWDEAFRLRDLLKFEFFFSEKEAFREEMRDEAALIDARWREGGVNGLAELGRALEQSGALMAHRVLRSFLEAYAIVADALAALGDEPADPSETVRACLALGRQYRLQRRVVSAEAVSTHLFRSGLELAANRDLLDAGPDLARRRAELAAELRDVVRRLRAIDRLDAERSL